MCLVCFVFRGSLGSGPIGPPPLGGLCLIKAFLSLSKIVLASVAFHSVVAAVVVVIVVIVVVLLLVVARIFFISLFIIIYRCGIFFNIFRCRFFIDLKSVFIDF